MQPGELTPEIASELNITSDGVVVYTVAPEGPAAKAGLRPGDVLTSVGDLKVKTVEELFAALRKHEPGQVVTISYLRDGDNHTARVRVADRLS